MLILFGENGSLVPYVTRNGTCSLQNQTIEGKSHQPCHVQLEARVDKNISSFFLIPHKNIMIYMNKEFLTEVSKQIVDSNVTNYTEEYKLELRNGLKNRK